MTQKKVKIVGKNLFDEEREYTFQIMNASDGLEVFHNTVSGLMELTNDFISVVPSLQKIVSNSKERKKLGELTDDELTDLLSPELFEVVRLIPKILTWDKITYLAENILSGCEVNIDGEMYTTPENGIGEYTIGDPLELYTALLYGVCANYPKYVQGITDPDQKKDSPQEQKPATKSVKIRKRRK